MLVLHYILCVLNKLCSQKNWSETVTVISGCMQRQNTKRNISKYCRFLTIWTVTSFVVYLFNNVGGKTLSFFFSVSHKSKYLYYSFSYLFSYFCLVVRCSTNLKWKTCESSDKCTVPGNDYGRQTSCVFWKVRCHVTVQKCI